MASNSFGKLFRITTWGESHGKAIGVVIDGCPAGLLLSDADINAALSLRAPGRSPHTSPRKEADVGEILSGLFEGKTTGAPISIIIPNRDADSSKYEPIKDLLRPGHANFTYLEKYGVFDWRGGGRASARETACRVAAGAVARKLLRHYNIEVTAFLKQVGSVVAADVKDPEAAGLMAALIETAMAEGDSLGGVVECTVNPLPAGLGDPIYEKLEANLAKAMLSLPASKGFEIGSGFSSAQMVGSRHNDPFIKDEDGIRTDTNYAGGTLGGISTGMPLICRVVFKPTSSIMKKQDTVTANGDKAEFQIPEGSRHDPCVAIRAVPVVEAMAALCVVDSLLQNRSAKL